MLKSKDTDVDHVFTYFIQMNAVGDDNGHVYNKLFFNIEYEYMDKTYKYILQILFEGKTDESAILIVVEYPHYDEEFGVYQECESFSKYDIKFLNQVVDLDNRLMITHIVDCAMHWIDSPMNKYHLQVKSIELNKELSE